MLPEPAPRASFRATSSPASRWEARPGWNVFPARRYWKARGGRPSPCPAPGPSGRTADMWATLLRAFSLPRVCFSLPGNNFTTRVSYHIFPFGVRGCCSAPLPLIIQPGTDIFNRREVDKSIYNDSTMRVWGTYINGGLNSAGRGKRRQGASESRGKSIKMKKIFIAGGDRGPPQSARGGLQPGHVQEGRLRHRRLGNLDGLEQRIRLP